MSAHIAAEVDAVPVLVSEVDGREARLRASPVAAALPRPGTSEGRQLRRWLTQLLVAERVVAVEAARRGVTADRAPSPTEVLPDATAHIEIGSVPAALLTTSALARAVFAAITADVTVAPDAAHAYYARNQARFAAPPAPNPHGWRIHSAEPGVTFAPFEAVREHIEADLLRAARRRTFARWLDRARAELVHLHPGYEHPGDPRQPDNTHRH